VEYAIYPNPTYDRITITSKNELKEIELMDVSGKVIRTIKCSSDSETVDLQDLSNGLYLLRCKTATGTFIEKIIKQNN